jgi:hypothetical protein
MQKAPFLTLKFQPYENRTEHVNIGIVTFVGDDVRVHLLANLRKAKALDPSVNLDHVRSWEADLPKLIKLHPFTTIEEKKEFVTDSLPFFQLSEGFGTISFVDEHHYHIKVGRMLDSLAEPNSLEKRERLEQSRLSVDLRRMFSMQSWLGKNQDDISNHLIVPKYTLSESEGVVSEFALRNGCLHVINSVDMRSAISAQKKSEAKGKAIIYDVAKRLEADNKPMGYFIMAGAIHQSDAKPIINLMHHYADEVLHWEDASDMNFLMNKMAIHTGKPMLELPL